jgi:hypothetical protein
VAVGDFNGDGLADLAVANRGDNGTTNPGSLSILLGKGDGTFQAAVNYAAGTFPYAVAVGDFNRDGIADLVLANHGSNDVSVLLGNGDGTFQAAVNYPAGPSPSGVAVGDFNGDGIPDLAVANYLGTGTVSVLLGKGDGTFQAPQMNSLGDGPFFVAVGDFNGDGITDLAVVMYGFTNDGNTVAILLGNGDGTFQAAKSYNVGLEPFQAAVRDFNGDGYPDLVLANYINNGTVNVLLGNGDGTFQAPQPYSAGGSGPSSVAVGDFNGDGKPDLAVALNNTSATGTTVSILLGNGRRQLPGCHDVRLHRQRQAGSCCGECCFRRRFGPDQ